MTAPFRFHPRIEELESRLAPATLAYSTNWAGYAVNTTAGLVSQVSGTWVVPAVSSSVSGYSASWVGIDGVMNSPTVEQTGTSSDFVNGQANYYAWYEMYPAAPVTLSLTISPGDTMSASVSYIGSNQFQLTLTNVTTSVSFNTTQTSSQALRSSAEWIEEAPSSFTGTLPLANFGTAHFAGAQATVSGTTGPADNSWANSTLYQVNMVTKNGSLKATTSALSDSGSPATSSFSVTFVSSGAAGGGKGGGHKAPNAPADDTSALVSLAATSGGPGAQATLSASSTPPSAVTATSSVTFTGPVATASLATTAQPFAHFGSDVSAVDAGVNDANDAQLPAPNMQANVETLSLARVTAQVQTDIAPPSALAEASFQTGQSGASVADAAAVPEAQDSAATLPESRSEQNLGLAGLVLTLSVNRTWAAAQCGKPGRPNRVPTRPKASVGA